MKFLPYFIQTVNFNVFLHAISPFRKKKIKEQNLDMIYSLWVYLTEFRCNLNSCELLRRGEIVSSSYSLAGRGSLSESGTALIRLAIIFHGVVTLF